MRITVRIPDDLGDTVKATTDNVSAYVADALREKIERDRRRAARQNILDGIRDYDGPGAEEGAEDQLHEDRRTGDRTRLE
jgi:post-segregation antitoxin (ccd killing protein)